MRSPQSLILLFTKVFGRRLPNEALVSYCDRWVSIDGVTDRHGNTIPGLGPLQGKVALFFVDKVPDATWGHECSYVAITPEGAISKADHFWPPDTSLQFVPLDRL